MAHTQSKRGQRIFGAARQNSTVEAQCLVPHWTFARDANAWERLDAALIGLQEPRAIRIAASTWHDKNAFDVLLKKATSKDVRSLTQPTERSLGIRLDYSLLQFSTTLDFPGTAEMPLTHHPLPKIGPPHVTYFTEDDAWEHWNRFLPDTLSLTVQTFLMSVSIAYSGAVRATDLRWTVNGVRMTDRHGSVDPLSGAVEYLSENNLGPTNSLPLDVVHNWVCSKNGIFDGYGDTTSSKALNLFTRLFSKEHRDDEMTNLMWALAGIEALLVRGGRSSKGQLGEKLNAIFEDRADQKWLWSMIDRTYDYRSRMVHGNRPLRSHFRRNEDDTAKRFFEEYDSERFAVGILLLLLQTLIEKGVDGFEFETRLKPPTSS